MKVAKFFLSLFSNPKKAIALDSIALIDFKNQLIKAEKTADPLEGIVIMFDIISRWQDEGKISTYIKKIESVNYGQHDILIEMLKDLNLHIRKAGREPYGYNRTKAGETVTAENVFLGNRRGLFTKNVAYWKLVPERYLEIDDQAKEFMQSHIQPMDNVLAALIHFGKI